jgi:hypothetical protein
MSLLKEILKEVQPLPIDTQLKVICDKITEEEISNDDYFGPSGPNVFLSLRVDTEEGISYLCLEREAPGKFIISGWKASVTLNQRCKRIKVWEISGNKADIIIREYARHMKFLKGD